MVCHFYFEIFKRNKAGMVVYLKSQPPEAEVGGPPEPVHASLGSTVTP